MGGPAAAGRRVAIVGGGASGLLTAWMLQDQHEVVVFEADARLGGHVRTVPVAHEDGQVVYAEAGFKYFFDRTNPYMRAVFDLLGMTIEWTDAAMTLPHPKVASDLVLPPRNARQLALLLSAPAALRDLLCLSTLRLAYDEVVTVGDTRTTIEELLSWRRFPNAAHPFLYSFISSSWGAPMDVMARFPAYNVLALLSSPAARYKRVGYLPGGSSSYIEALTRDLARCTLRRGTPVRRVERRRDAWHVSADGVEERFDAVVLALPAWHAARIVVGADRWKTTLSAFHRFDARIAIHRDPSFMPAERRDWSLSNVSLRRGRTMLTSWEGLRQRRDVFRSWMLPGEAPERLEVDIAFEHLLVDADSASHRARLETLQGRDDLYAVGMYTGDVDCHESCVTSALAAAERLSPQSPSAARIRRRAESRAADEERQHRRTVARLTRPLLARLSEPRGELST